MAARTSLDWRRWIAMLCIALVTVFALDVVASAAPCDNAACTSVCDLGGCNDQDENGAPCVEHHCCHGTAASDPGAGGSIFAQIVFDSEPIARDEFAPSGYLDALERPPRTSTAI